MSVKQCLWLISIVLGCTDADLYDAKRAPIEANRLAVSGRVCTEDPEVARFPVRVVLVADHAGGPLFSDFDPGGERVRKLAELVQETIQRSEYSIAIVGYGGRAQKLAPADRPFGRNPGELLNAVNRLSVPEPCLAGDYCRDYNEAIRVAGNIIEDDLAGMRAGDRGLTQYVVLVVNSGQHQPFASNVDCCSRGDTVCQNAEGAPSITCQQTLDARQVVDLKEAVINAGASSFELHVMHLAAEPEVETNDVVGQSHERMAFIGGGRYVRVNNVSSLDLRDLRVFDRQNALRVKHFLVSNQHAVPRPDGLESDSDADGLSDGEERLEGTDPSEKDSDGDGVGDFVELIVATDPKTPDVFESCVELELGRDLDADGLNDCEEAILGTEPSLVDTDGDGMPDGIEMKFGTDYLNRDFVDDEDGDGVANGDEVREHTDPRNTDLNLRLGSAYRYTIEDEGTVSEPLLAKPESILGVDVLQVGLASVAGVGVLDYDLGADEGLPPTLSWKDPADGTAGPTVALDRGDGIYRLPSSSYALEQGDQGRFIRVRVAVDQLPPNPTSEILRLRIRERQCLSYIVRNIRLMQTTTGRNDIYLYFAEAPGARLQAPGPFRIARLPIDYVPPDIREPSGANLPVLEDEFVHYPRREEIDL